MQNAIVQDFLETVLATENAPLILVIKGHHALDIMLDELLRLKMHRADALEIQRISFLLKVDLLVGLGAILQPQREFFKRVNAVRNCFAHDPHAKLDAQAAKHIQSDLIAQKLISADFAEIGDELEIYKTLFAVCVINLIVAMERLQVMSVECEVVNQIAGEVLRKEKRLEEAGLDVHERFRRRVQSLLAQRHPEITWKPNV
jgi:hypothetical protein